MRSSPGLDAVPRGRAATPDWSTGHEKADDWLTDKGIEPDVLSKLAEVPRHVRVKLVSSTIAKDPDNPNAWLAACVRNWKDNQMMNNLLQTASVHRSSSGRPSGGSHSDRQRPASDATRGRAANRDPDTSDLVPRTGTPPAEESWAMKENWPRNKSCLISILMHTLDDEATERFLELDPEDQCAMCFAFMLMAARGDTPESKNVLVKGWLDRLAQLDGSAKRPPSRSPSQIATTQKFQVQIIMAGMPSIMAGFAAFVLTQVPLTLHRDMEVEFYPSIYLDVNKEDPIPIKDVADTYGLSFHPRVQNFEDLATVYEEMLPEWVRTNTKFIFVANLGFPPTPDEKISDLEASRLHMSDSQWIWSFSQAAQIIRQRTQDSDVAEIFFGPQAPAFEEQISSLWGEATPSNAAQHPKVPVAMPNVFSTPSGFTVLSVIDNEALKKDPIDHWGAHDLVDWKDKHGNTIPISPSNVSKLMVMKLFKERQLRKIDEDYMRAVTVKADNGLNMSMGRERWMTLYGYKVSPIEQLVESALPCCQHVIPTTGEAARKPSKISVPCGQQRYCRQCERLFNMIDKSYPTYVVGDVLLALFTKVAPTWSGKDAVDTAMWARKTVKGRDHKCGPSCPGHL